MLDCKRAPWDSHQAVTALGELYSTFGERSVPPAFSGWVNHSTFGAPDDPLATALPKKWYGGKRQANTGSAGALARYEREARNSYSVKKFEIERAAHAPAGEGARAPSTNRLVPDRIDFLGKAARFRLRF
ncbi:MAG: hypothetical protein DMF73_02860 [Acidobacteria bacterium]|nr:MAG: hypothetical protein DMF73_02860 [Acidobacteriota bacterium]